MPTKILKTAGFLALVFIVAVGGLYVGTKVRARLSDRQPAVTMADFMTHELPLEGPFPDVTLHDEADQPRACRDLLEGGAIVLFLDPDCTPCTDMGRRWQACLDAGSVAPGSVWAVSFRPREQIAVYAEDHGFTFPIYEDRDRVFRTQYRVTQYPLEVVVGGSGTIRSISFDSVSPIDPALIASHLSH